MAFSTFLVPSLGVRCSGVPAPRCAPDTAIARVRRSKRRTSPLPDDAIELCAHERLSIAELRAYFRFSRETARRVYAIAQARSFHPDVPRPDATAPAGRGGR
jgi:hypothetical protein